MAAHTPVLVGEVLELFQAKAGDTLLDATLGQGGHTRAYLNATAPTGHAVGLDADPMAVEHAHERLAPFGERFIGLVNNFATLKDSITGGGILKNIPRQYTHILFDLGIGSHQLDDVSRGFSWRHDAPLAMLYGKVDWLPPANVGALNTLEERLGRLPEVTDILQYLSATDLAEVIYTYGEERFRGRIAEALKENPSPTTSLELAERVSGAVPAVYRRGRIHPATRTFQALRLAVNRELEALTAALPQALDLLAPDGILAIISFHSLEDRIVKHTFRRYHQGQEGAILTKKPIRPGPAEIAANPRARSAKLRAIRKIKK